MSTHPRITLAFLIGLHAPLPADPSAQVDSTRVAVADPSAKVLREIQVQGMPASNPPADSTRLGFLGAMASDRTPFALQSVTAQEISDRGAHNLLKAVLGSAPIYAVMLPSNDGRGDAEPQLRGLDPNFLLDGLPLGSQIRPEVEACERIDVLDGPAAAFHGFAGTNLGGTVDFRLKAPLDTARATFGIGQYAGGLNHVLVDLGGPLDSARTLTYRFSAYREMGEGYVRGSDQRRSFALAAFDWKPIEPLKLRASASHHEFDFQGQQISFAVDSKKPWIPDADALDANTAYGQKWTFTRGTQDRILGGFEVATGGILAQASTEFARTWRQSRTVAGTLLSDGSGRYIEKYSDAGPSEAWNWAGNATVSTGLSTGIVSQRIGVGYTGLFNLQRSTALPTVGGVAIDTTSIANPVHTDAPELFATIDDHKRTRSITTTASLQDQAAIGPWADLVAGIGWTRIQGRTDNEIARTASGVYDQDGLAPSIGVVAKPFGWLHPYANWSRGLVAGGAGSTVANPTRSNPSPRNAGTYLEPSTDDAFEAGVKSPVRLAGLALDLSADIYWLDKVNEYTDPADSIYKQDGREIHRGAELSISGRILSRLRIQGSFSWIDAWIDRSQDGALDGKEPVNVPEEIGRLSIEYAFGGMPGLSAGGAVNWSGERAVDDANTTWLPSVATFDASLRYAASLGGHGIAIRAAVDNLAGASYWAAYKPKGTVGLVLGEPRTISISASVEL